jgi:DNA repair protein RadC
MSQRIQDIPTEDRPRERLLRLGPEALSDAELLGLFINTGVKGRNAVQIGQELLSQNGGLVNVARLPTRGLAKTKGVGPAKAAVLAAAFELGKRSSQAAKRVIPMQEPEQIYEYMALEMQALTQEELHVLTLDTRLCLQQHDRIFRGTVNQTTAHPRELLRHVVVNGGYAFVVVHNHPSGDPSPSESDRQFTKRIRDAAEVLQVRFLDHIIVAQKTDTYPKPWFSFRATGLLGPK